MRTLQDRLISAAEWHSSQNDYFQDGALLSNAAKRITDLEQNLMWRPIAESMPEPMVQVLMWDGAQVFVEQWWGNDFSLDHRITHWMPIPQPPEAA
jgi:hypothetical protein